MSQIRFHHVFVALLALSVLSAFVLPARVTNPARSNVQNVFAPVAVPIRKIAAAFRGRVAGDKPVDDARANGSTRDLKEVLNENTQLREMVSGLAKQLDELARVNAQRDTVGDIRNLCTPIAVMGADSGQAQSLSLLATSLDGIRDGMPVLYAGNIAGTIERVGLGGAQVRLVTDKGFKPITCSFARFTRNQSGAVEFARLAFHPSVIYGTGNNRLIIKNLAKRDVESAGLVENDWVVLDDPDWPLCLRGRRIGKIAAKASSHEGPLFVDLIVEPPQHLMALREVMVMTKEK